MGSGDDGNDSSAGARRAPAPVLEVLRGDLESFGLSGYEARVLTALLQLGAATPTRIAQLAHMGRTNVYPVLASLREKGLAEPSPGPAGVWAVRGREEVIDRLSAAEEERLREFEARKQRAKTSVEQLGAETPNAFPYIHMLRGPGQVRSAYQRLLEATRSELAMFTRPPYTYASEDPEPAVLEMLSRGVRARVLYEASLLTDPEAAALRRGVDVCHEAGVEGRVVDKLPVKLVVSDRKAVLFSTTDPVAPDVGFTATLLMEHPDVAAFALEAFERLWDQATPYRQAQRDTTSQASSQ